MADQPLDLQRLVETSTAIAATRSRKNKTAAMAELLGATRPDEAALAVSLLAGEPRQGRIGVGWAALERGWDVEPAVDPSLTLADVDAALDELARTHGAGSTARRDEQLRSLLGRAVENEADFLRRLLLGELRQGANEGLVVEGLAKAAGVKAATVRRALMLGGDLGLVATAAMTGGAVALEAIGLELGRPLRPMLASTAADVAEAVATLGQASVEWKLDGARIQVHRDGDKVRVWTRNLNEVTGRLSGVVDAVLGFDAESLVLDGEVIGLTEGDVPQAFQDTMSDFSADDRPGRSLRPAFFDLLHHDGTDLVDEPLVERLGRLRSVAGDLTIPGIVTDDATAAAQVLEEALAAGHEGVMLKAADSTYEAGRRGKSWRKVKPVHTLDLVVLAAEWGHGRRTGWLSNLHLGACGPDGTFVMVGKTFKGLTDEVLAWQTAALTSLEVEQRGITVEVRPELVVEIALDGVQSSSRYPGGVALRFARVRRYRDDKAPNDADTIETVQAMLS